jgi:nitrogen fixation protein FixH
MPAPQKNLYKPLILLLLCSFLVFSAWSAWQASSRGSQVTDRDYYSKGLKYNSTLVEKRAAEVLGWSLATEISGKTLTFHVTDGKDNNVTGAQGTLYLYRPGSPNGQKFQLHESSTGDYQVELPSDLDGTLRARVMFEREGARLNHQLQLNL